MRRLKPCPFCGGQAKLEDMCWPYHVFCTNCFAMVTSVAFGKDGENEAIEKWDRRTQQDARHRAARCAGGLEGGR